MPSYNITVDDVSPLFSYTESWKDSDKGDPMYTSYFNSTFHATEQKDATATLWFQGTAVYLYGAMRNNHGAYSVSLDGSSVTRNGFADPGQYQVPLFMSAGLEATNHTLVVTDLADNSAPYRPWFDIDYAIITAGDGDPSTSSHDDVLDDSDTNVSYTGYWQTSPNEKSSAYYMQTMHRTNNPNATAMVMFHGNAIAVYSAVSKNHGSFSVSVDGGPERIFSGSASDFHADTLLYLINGLKLTSHTLKFTNTGSDDLWFDLDRIVVSTWSTNSSSSSSLPTPGPSATSIPAAQSTTGRSRSHAGVIAGAIVGTLLTLCLLSGVILFFFRRRARGRRQQAHQQERASMQRRWPEKSEAWTLMADRRGA